MKNKLIIGIMTVLAVLIIPFSPVSAQSCATILNVSSSVEEVGSQQVFKCYVDVDAASAGSGSISCGINMGDFNTGFPENFCQSDIAFCGWQGNKACFTCVIPDTTKYSNSTAYLVGRDFRPSCANAPRTTYNTHQITLNKTSTGTPPDTNQNSSSSGSFDQVRNILLYLQGKQALNTTTGASCVNPNTSTIAAIQATDPRTSESETYLNEACHITSRTPVQGPPSITLDKMTSVLQSYKSPAAAEAEGIYNMGIKYNIDPAVLLAFFIKESSAGTAGLSVANKSIGNIVCTSGYTCSGRFRTYSSWTASAEDWYKLIHDLYVQKWGLVYVETIIPVYAPSFENDTCLYINQTVNRINSWK